MQKTIPLATLLLAILSLSQPAVSATAPTTGSISGSVVDASGLPVAGATVLYQNYLKFERDSTGHIRVVGPVVSSTVKTDATGAFTITGLPVADYYLCAAGVLAAQLRSCDWGASFSPVTVSAGLTATAAALTLRTGALVNVQVSDPNGRIAVGAKFGVGVLSPSGEYHRCNLLSSTAALLSYQVAVPMGASVFLFIDTALTVTDEKGNLVQTRAPGPLVSLGTLSETAVLLQVQ